MNLNCTCVLEDTQITFVFEGKQKKIAWYWAKMLKARFPTGFLFLKEEK